MGSILNDSGSKIKTDKLLPLLFFVMFLVIVGIIIYLIYDYMNHKSDIAESISKVDEGIESVKSNAVPYTQYEKDKIWYKNDMENTSNILTSVQQKTNKTDKSLSSFDSSLKQYFTFYDDSRKIQNDKLYEHAFSGNDKDIDLLSKVNATSGLTVTTTANKRDSKNVKICNNGDECIQMNVDANGFNITPDNVKGLSINGKDNSVITKYDMNDNSIYFGGSNMNTSPMFIKDGKMYVNNMSFIYKNDENDVITQQDLDNNSEEINGVMLSGIKNALLETAESVLFYQDHIADAIDNAYDIAAMIDDVQVHYYLNNEYVYENETGDIYTPSYTDQTITLKLIANRDMNEGDEIHITLPEEDIGRFTSTSRGDPNSRDIDVPNIGKYYIEANMPINQSLTQVHLSNHVIIVSIASYVQAKTPIMLQISGKNIVESRSTLQIYGITIGKYIPENDQRYRLRPITPSDPNTNFEHDFNNYSRHMPSASVYDLPDPSTRDYPEDSFQFSSPDSYQESESDSYPSNNI